MQDLALAAPHRSAGARLETKRATRFPEPVSSRLVSDSKAAQPLDAPDLDGLLALSDEP
ncbi:MAG: hypothetical protein HYR85_23380 [Planctomycetes bacterium]|nr:hypothetical protein [Planctomycetota bacterium]